MGFQRQFLVYLLCECHHVSGEMLCEFHCDISLGGGGGGVTQGQPKGYAHVWLQNKGDTSNCVRLSIPSFQSLMASPSRVSCFPLGNKKSRCPPKCIPHLVRGASSQPEPFGSYPRKCLCVLYLFCVACNVLPSLLCFLMSLGTWDSV